MITTVGLALGLAAGIDWRRLAVLACAVHLPLLLGLLIGLLPLIRRGPKDTAAAVFCEAVASELRSGASLQLAINAAADSIGALPSGEQFIGTAGLATTVAQRFPEISEELRLVIANSLRSGNDTAALFDEIGSLAIAKAEVRREVRMASAPGKMTALVLIAAPVSYLTLQAGSGALGDLLTTPHQRTAGMIGLALFLVGAAIAAMVTVRASR
jgi:Flp pilus assembly protein TadB